MNEVLVLFGSQTGNSEQTADTIAQHIPTICDGKITARAMQMDDFLENMEAKWPRLIIIVTSSYGVGQAPLGAYKFRELCDEKSSTYPTLLANTSYLMLGLGDSKYTTFFQNPTAIDEGMRKFGAKRIGELGKADASKDQAKAIKEWVTNVCYPNLKDFVAQDEFYRKEGARVRILNDLLKSQQDTYSLCVDLWPVSFHNFSYHPTPPPSLKRTITSNVPTLNRRRAVPGRIPTSSLQQDE